MVAVGGGKRLDVQGLRAVAVFLVIGDHLLGWPRGGFVGVDVFFVISGYIISVGLLREYRTTGWVSIFNFYRRRLRRILPMALVVAVLTITAAFIIWFLSRAIQTLLDGLSAALFVSNYHFAGQGLNYLGPNDVPSPFQHYWSLSVEEQFYIAWPWVIVVAGFLAARVRRSAGSITALVVVTASLASFAWSVALTDARPTLAYFDTISRLWEFGAGVTLALVAARLRRIPTHWSVPISIGGLLLILLSAIVISPETKFPGPWAVAPVVGAAFVIAGTDRRILGSRPMVYLGDISYSLYLWHWPLMVFALAFFSKSLAVGLTCVALTIALSSLSYRYIEARFQRAKRPVITSTRRKSEVAAGATIAVAAIVLAAASLRGTPAITTAGYYSADRVAAAETFNSASVVPAVASGVAATSWSDLRPSVGELTDAQQTPAMSDTTGCRNPVGRWASPLVCRYPGRGLNVWVVGDSVAMSWVPTIVDAYRGTGQVRALGFASCSPFKIDTTPRVLSASFLTECRKARAATLDLLRTQHPDVVVVTSDLGGYERRAAKPSWRSAAQQAIAEYRSIARTVIVLSDPPTGTDVRSCADRFNSPGDCIRTLDPAWAAKSADERSAARKEGAAYIDTRSWFCTDSGRCPSVIGGYLVRLDSVHLTNAFAEALGPVLRDTIKAIA